jgi:CheY-like chemotaxis protein
LAEVARTRAYLNCLAATPTGPRTVLAFVNLPLRPESGFALIRWLREQRAFTRLPIVVFAGGDLAKDVESARAAGATSPRKIP